ncbi:hypothetical protein IMSHALPRED_008447 [Imshaugia aleurites]|uniref:Protein kinase domain-containing protein n=1 Tax=Imshaugia aleurites TaxID=172621 RepID=A0A8H3ESM7_9LECA|nr:hypothetical protein IMSHALPRED_008447 [Imshaugia aleurites]
MAGIIGEAASIASFVSLSFVLLSAAQELGSRGDVLACQLEWEHYRLQTWARFVGLFNDPPELNVFNPTLVQSTLANLEQLLTNAAKLKEHYGLDIIITDEEIREVRSLNRRFGCLLEKTKPQFINDTARVYARRNNAWRKVRWGAIDSNRLRLLLKDIRYFNKRLLSVLHPSDQELNYKDESSVMRSIVAQSPDKALLDAMSGPLEMVDETVAAAARLRHKGLLLELIGLPSCGPPRTSRRAQSTTNVSTTHHKCSPLKGVKNLQQSPDLLSLCQGPVSAEVSREVVQYDGRPVIVEWKDVASAVESKLKYRITRVAAFLTEMRSPAFHSLTCFGFLKASRTGRYAYLFRPSNASCTAFSMWSLNELLYLGSLRPRLNTRLGIALAMAETVLQLHTAGWLHKGIRADNILFFKSGTEQWNSKDDLSSAYLGGYEYARADNPLETTEAPSSKLHSELYRHPNSLGQGRASFHKRFDLYSLGCVLLEVAFWLPLPTILLQRLRGQSDEKDAPCSALYSMAILGPRNDTEYYLMVKEKQKLLEELGTGSIRAELEFQMGNIYSKLVMDCLHAERKCSSSADEELDDSLELQETIVSTLRNLLDVL